jgi:hypothetical protein
MTLLFSTSSDAVLSNNTEVPCAEADLECLHRALQLQAIEIESLGRQLATEASRVKSADELVQIWRDQANAAYDAAKSAVAALKPMPWFYHPALWVAVGATVAAVLTIAIVYALRPAFQ